MKRCLQCLIPAGISVLHETYSVDEATPDAEKVNLKDNRCQFCRTFNQHFDPAYLREEVNAFVQTDKPILVALSGGKNSLVALVLAKEKLGLNLVALTVDNGFITDNVLKFTEKTCKKLKIPWTCIKKPLLKEFQEEFQPDEDGIWQAKTGLDFNTFATQEMHKAIREWSIENGSHRVIMGSRIHTHMEPRVSCLDMQTIEQGELNFSLCYIHLLFGLSVNNIRRKRILSDLGWKEPKIKGFSHSSVLPGFADPAWRRKMGYGTDTGYLETELRCGAHTLQEAKEMIRNAKGMDLSPQITRFFQDK